MITTEVLPGLHRLTPVVKENAERGLKTVDMVWTREPARLKSRSGGRSVWLVRACFIFFKFIGLATFTINYSSCEKKNGKQLLTIVYTRTGIAYNMLLTIVTIIWNIQSIPFRYQQLQSDHSFVTIGIEIVQSEVGTMILCVIFIVYCVDQRLFIKILQRITDVDRRLDVLNRSSNREEFSNIYIYLCLLNTFFCIGVFVSQIYMFGSEFFWVLIDVLPVIIISWFMIQYFLAVTLVNVRFTEVNRAVQNLSRNYWPESRSQPLSQHRRVLVTNTATNYLIILRDVNGLLSETCNDISDFFGLPCLSAITFIFLTLLYNVYYFFLPFLHQYSEHEPINFVSMINSVCWITVLLYPLTLMTIRNTQIMKEIGKTGVITHNLLACSIGKDIKTELKQFSMELLHRKIQFTACGFFVLDNTLLHMIIGAVSTYLVILIQFEMGKLPNNCT